MPPIETPARIRYVVATFSGGGGGGGIEVIDGPQAQSRKRARGARFKRRAPYWKPNCV
jgi:hypothetical protein